MKNFVQPGDSLDLIAPSGGVVAGAPVKIGSIIAVPAITAPVGATFSGAVTGVFDLAAATSQAWTQGVLLYWDDTAKNFTTTVGSNQKAGYAVDAKLAAAAVGRVRLQPTI